MCFLTKWFRKGKDKEPELPPDLTLKEATAQWLPTLCQQAMDRTQEFEGCNLKLYRCNISSKFHIGYGRNIEDLGITQDEADFLFVTDLDRSRQEFFSIFREWDYRSTFFNLTEEEVVDTYSRLPVFIDMIFNLGLTKFLTFRKLIAAARERNWEEAAKELMDSRYAQQVPKRAKRNARWLKKGHE